jgi:hypothetical protein
VGSNGLIGLWIAVVVLLGLFVGAGAGVLAWSERHRVAAAVLTGGGAFGATVTLGIMILNALHSR